VRSKSGDWTRTLSLGWNVEPRIKILMEAINAAGGHAVHDEV
jgi:hypothetical protein